MTLTLVIKKGFIRNIYVKYKTCITYNSKDVANVRVFADKQTDKRTGQKQYIPYLLMRGHKRTKNSLVSSHLFINLQCTFMSLNTTQ